MQLYTATEQGFEQIYYVSLRIWLQLEQNRETYTKSQDMKRFIIDAIIHCNWTRIWTNSLRFTAYLITIGNKVEKLT